MSVVLYARVSTSHQGEKDLSIPAQLRTLRRLCSERGWSVACSFTDIASGTSIRQRPGLLSAVEHASQDKDVDILFVHRLDRLARDVFIHLTIKAKLLRHGVRVVSAVENCDSSPVGQFIENIMAAQAEFYSANLALQVKGGIEERLRRGKWFAAPALGYIKERGEVVVDPARGRFITMAFERWATGVVTTVDLAEELHRAGLVSRHGKMLLANKLAALLHNPFYLGEMFVAGKRYAGVHPPLITRELFDRCQEVFRQKNSGGQPRHHLHFLLNRKLVCPGCLCFLVGEQHEKRSGKVYRYYRCRQPGCRFIVRANEVEERVVAHLAAELMQDEPPLRALVGSDPVTAKTAFDGVVDQIRLDSNNCPEVVLLEQGSQIREVDFPPERTIS